MLIDRPQVVEGSAIQNATVPSGTTFPSSPSLGEMFQLTAEPAGFYTYNGTDWEMAAKNVELQTHVHDDTRHISAQQNEFLDGFIKEVSIDPEDLNRLPEFFNVLENHVADESRHVSPEEKSLLSGIVSGGVDFTEIGALKGISGLLGAGQTLGQYLAVIDSNKVSIDGSSVMTGNFNVGGKRIVNLAHPVNATDAVNKDYVDNFVQGVHWVKSVRAATTGNITLNGLQAIDGVNVQPGDRVLVKDQTDPRQNGIWIAAFSAWSRAPDFNVLDEVNSAAVFVLEGTGESKSTWLQIGTVNIIGDDPITWTAFSGPVLTSAGPGVMIQAGGLVSIRQGAGLTFENEELRVDSHPTGGLHLTVDGETPSTDAAAKLALTPVGTPGTYTKVTTDTTGRVTAGSNPTTLAGYGITDAVTIQSLSDPDSPFLIDGGNSYTSPTKIVVKRSGTTQALPTTTQLAFGELAVNTADGKIFMKAVYNGVETVFQLAGYPATPTGSDTVIPSEYATLLKYS